MIASPLTWCRLGIRCANDKLGSPLFAEQVLRELGRPRDTPLMYSEAVIDHFQNPRNVGTLDTATATISVENPVCGDILELSARMEAGRDPVPPRVWSAAEFAAVIARTDVK